MSIGSVPGCPRCGVLSYVDLPAPGATVTQGALFIAGWGFECESGLFVNRVDVWVQNDEGFYVPLPVQTFAKNLPRPDIVAAYQPSCPHVTSNSGWHCYLIAPPPFGTRNLAINVWREPYVETHIRSVTIVA